MRQRGTIVYVHGASDRAPQVADHVARIEQQLALAGMALDVLPSRWGERTGADLSRIELALPSLEPIMALPAAPLEPQLELEALASLADGAGASGTDVRRQSDELLDVCRSNIGAPGELVQLSNGASIPLAAACRSAANSVGDSSAYEAARRSAVPEPVLLAAVGRAVVSTVAAPAASPTGVAQLVEIRIAEAVLGAAIATVLVGYLGIDVGPDLKRWATDVLVPQRARLIREAGLGPADIMLYQRSGEAIRRVVTETLHEALGRRGPLVALGNSLGGIILVDALSHAGAPSPDLLVTVGSQAPLLATFGALDPLGIQNSSPPFQPWLNIYDKRDLLGFTASAVWPDAAGITDHQIDLGVGFPDSHGASYLSSPDVFQAIRQHPALGGSNNRTVERFTIATRGMSWLARLVLGARPETSFVELDDLIRARVGWFEVSTPLSNVQAWQRLPARRGVSLLAMARALLGRVGILGAGSSPAVGVHFRRPVRLGMVPIDSVELSAHDASALEMSLAARGVAGS